MSSDEIGSGPKAPLAPRERPGPVGGKRQLNRQHRIEQLHAAGLELFLERGIEGVTIDDIVGRASMAKGSFYRYFEGKAQLVESILEPLFTRTRAAIERCGRQIEEAEDEPALNAAYQALAIEFVGLVELGAELRLYLQECRSPAGEARQSIVEFAQYLEARTLRFTQVAQEHHLLRVDSDPRVTTLAVIGAAERLFVGYLDRAADPAETAAVGLSFISVILDGLRPR